MTLDVTFTDLQGEVARELGWDRTAGNWSAVQNSDFAIILDSGLRKFYSGEIPGESTSHQWTFLYPIAELELSASYSTGTITTASGDATVVLTTGVWPTWTAEGELWYTSTAGGEQKRYEVLSRTSDTHIELTENVALADITTAGTYTLRRVHYVLPTDFGGMESDSFAYRRDQQWHLPNIQIVGEADIRRLDRENNGDIYPRYATLAPIAPTASASTQWRVRFYPLAEQAYTVEYRYKVNPATVTSGAPYAYGGVFYAEAIIAAVLDAAQQRIHGSKERHAEFLSCMRQAIFHDRRAFAKHTLGRGVGDRYSQGNTLAEFRRNTPMSNVTTSF